MVTTGLVSLNVHEALIFDGTPICLHPDLFSEVSDGMSYHSGVTTVIAGNRDGKGRSLLNSAVSMEDGRMVNCAPSTLSESKGLRIGNMLEIRVWDPLPKAQNSAVASSNASSVMRQRSSTQVYNNTSNASSASQPISVTSSTSSTAGDGTVPEGTPPTLTRIRSGSSNAANNNLIMQYSDGSSVADIMEEIAESSNASSEDPSLQLRSPVTLLSKTIAAPAVDDATTTPVSSPRTRTIKSENFIRNPVVTKPPMQRRSVASQQDINKPRSSSTTKTAVRHIRDLSDMTADTACGTIPLDNAQHLSDFHLPSGSGGGDDEDDLMWNSLSHTHSLRLSFVMLVTEKTLTSLKGSARTQVSILRQVADLYHLSSYDMVSIHRVNRDEEESALQAVSADFVLVTIKDQFISRGDMHFFQESLIGSWVYEGQRLYEASRGLQANAREIRHCEQQALSGIVTEKTVITFRSRSSRIIWLVQISSEMWEYGSPYGRGHDESLCEIYFDVWIAFIHKLFVKWKELEATHSLTVVFFSRSFLPFSPMADAASQHDVYGRRYKDHFRIVLENETGPDWDSLVVRIKEGFVRYPLEVGWTTGDDGVRPSTACHGNLLEAINVTLNLLQFHYLDRDLQRTGNSIVVVSAGNGVFEVDRGLAGITYQVRSYQNHRQDNPFSGY